MTMKGQGGMQMKEICVYTVGNGRTYQSSFLIEPDDQRIRYGSGKWTCFFSYFVRRTSNSSRSFDSGGRGSCP